MRCRNKLHLQRFTSDAAMTSKSKDFTKHDQGGSARLVDLCTEDRVRVATLVDELGKHAERTRAAEARIVQLSDQLKCRARNAEETQKTIEEKQAKETAELRRQLAERTQVAVELREKLDSTTRSLAETQTRLEAESRAAAEREGQVKQAEQKYSDLRRNAAKVAELNRELESRLAALEAHKSAWQHACTQTEPTQQMVPRVPTRAPTQSASRESAVLSELFFKTSTSPPELEDLFFLPSTAVADDGHALFDS